MDNQHTKAVLLSADLVMVSDDFCEELARAIVQEIGCPIEHILIAATHTHGSPVPHAKPIPGQKSNTFLSFDGDYAARIKQGAMAAVRQAKTNLQPACMGYGTGRCYLNVNRDAIHFMCASTALVLEEDWSVVPKPCCLIIAHIIRT